ncbi:MAG: monovalent cation/H+ antiporter subunit D [Thiomicrorhabdus sp.]|nr:monovalent cation/H+ antiporter subunit D [Thiomicrorhabdus sp.]
MLLETFMPVLLPLISGILVLLIKKWGIGLQRIVSLLAILVLIIASLSAMQVAVQLPPQVYALGNWVAPFGIVMVLDELSASLVLITALLALAALWYAVRQNIDQQGAHFHVLFHIQLFGLNGAFMTGDVFNLFVFFEVLLLASYGLLLHGGGRLKTRAGLHYVALNLIGSTLFLFAVGALYGILGTLNLADMADKIANLSEENQGVVAAAGLMLLLVFGIKAAMFPLYLWLPQAYSNTSAPIAALFAIMTKVGLYAIIRIHGTLFGEQAGDLAFIHIDWVLWLGLITLFLAALGVMAARNLREQVSYLVLASVATLLIGIGLNSLEAMSATLFYLIHSTLIAGAMFLIADWIRQGRGEAEDQFIRAYAMPKSILVGSIFMIGAIAMTGLPPLSGFIGKLLILSSALSHPSFFWILAVVLISGLLMIIAMARSGSLLFYNVLPQEECHIANNKEICETPKTFKLKGGASVIGLLSMAVILVVFAKPFHEFTDSVANQVFNSYLYQQQVLQVNTIANPYKELVE